METMMAFRAKNNGAATNGGIHDTDQWKSNKPFDSAPKQVGFPNHLGGLPEHTALYKAGRQNA